MYTSNYCMPTINIRDIQMSKANKKRKAEGKPVGAYKCRQPGCTKLPFKYSSRADEHMKSVHHLKDGDKQLYGILQRKVRLLGLWGLLGLLQCNFHTNNTPIISEISKLTCLGQNVGTPVVRACLSVWPMLMRICCAATNWIRTVRFSTKTRPTRSLPPNTRSNW